MATIRDVAKRAGVSITTVSHIINESRFVSQTTAERVLRAMQELHYQPNALARSLRSKHSHTLGLVLPDASNPFFAEVARGLEDYAFDHGYNVLFGSSDGNLQRERDYLRVFLEKQVDGLIFVAAGESTENIRELQAEHLPLVVVDREFRQVTADYVIADNYRGGYLATEHLINLGRHVIACITGPSTVTPSADRVTGYRDALKAHGIRYCERLVRRGDFTAASGFRAMQSLLTHAEPPTAVFACNDLMALGVLCAATKAGLRVPDDVAVVGFDDIALACLSSPPLTTIQQPKAEMGRLASELLIARIEGRAPDAPQRCLLQTRLIVRESTCGEASRV